MPMWVVSAHIVQNLDAETVELAANKMVQVCKGFTQKEILRVLVANNQLPSCTFSTTECLQWWAFKYTLVHAHKHPLQDVGPEMGVGICPAYTSNFTVQRNHYNMTNLSRKLNVVIEGM